MILIITHLWVNYRADFSSGIEIIDLILNFKW